MQWTAAINEDLEHINSMLYAYVTPSWRLILGKARRLPLPSQPPAAPDELLPVEPPAPDAECVLDERQVRGQLA